ncbi:MAG: hypothetical protein QJR02_01505 [Sinobacteraceae bacterium]|nr:hypothetical protein [Nevskiaceae bacterium]
MQNVKAGSKTSLLEQPCGGSHLEWLWRTSLLMTCDTPTVIWVVGLIAAGFVTGNPASGLLAGGVALLVMARRRIAHLARTLRHSDSNRAKRQLVERLTRLRRFWETAVATG